MFSVVPFIEAGTSAIFFSPLRRLLRRRTGECPEKYPSNEEKPKDNKPHHLDTTWIAGEEEEEGIEIRRSTRLLA